MEQPTLTGSKRAIRHLAQRETLSRTYPKGVMGCSYSSFRPIFHI
ncbi:hypothetical protein [Desulfogranum japonicum]|nr:hypothetical protein [Desulfogranum japonicum]